MKIGNININNIKLGIVQIKKVFIGLDLVWIRSFLTIISDFKTRVLGNQGQFEAETCLNVGLEEIGIDLFENASLVLTPNGYKEQILYSVTPSPVGTNLLLQSENLTISPWTLLATPNVTRLANAGTSPTGTNTATLITSNSDLVSRGIRQNVTLLTGTSYVFSVWVRSDNGAQISIDIGDVGSSTFTLTSDWQKIETTIPSIFLQFVDIVFRDNQLGKSFYVWGAQLEYGSTAGNYIPTTTRQVINETICDFTVTRATTATRVNSSGLVEVTPYNIFTRSTEFELSNWTKNLLTISTTYSTAPNGLVEARTVKTAIDAATGRHRILQGFASTVVVGDTYIFSVYAKKNQHRWIQLNYTVGFDTNDWANFDLETGTIGNTGTGAIATIQDVGNGWYRLSIKGLSINISPSVEILVINNTNSGRYPSYQSLVAEDVFDIWGAQVVAGNDIKDYYPTGTRFNIPRLDYSNGTCPSLLVEPLRTNLLLHSTNFTNGWLQEGTSVTGKTQTGPDGLLTAGSIFELSINDVHRTYRSAITTIANTNYTTSFFVKKNNIRYVRVVITQSASSTIWTGAQFDLDTETFTSQVGTDGGTFVDATITPFSNGWYRISVSGSITGTAMIPMLVLSNGSTMLNTDTRGCPVYLGNTSNSLYVWGAQLELGSVATSYIPTTTATVTRNIDNISRENIRTLIGQTEGVFYAELQFFEGGNRFNGIELYGNTNNRIYIAKDNNDLVTVGFNNNGTNTTITSYVSGYNMFKVAIKYKSGASSVFINGSLVNTSTVSLGFSATIDRLNFYVNNSVTNYSFHGLLSKMMVFNTILSDIELQKLTTLYIPSLQFNDEYNSQYLNQIVI